MGALRSDWTGNSCEELLEADDLRDRGHSVDVHQKQHVIAGGA
jgi:hypothetical protein